ncbi:MAG: sugar nucleotide-binding protein [Patescibacteria group bacterium]|jgi:dTDP-4-dehydrorhamnose reductase
MNEKILIFGNGQMGNFYKEFFNKKGIAAEIAKADITRPEEIEKAITGFSPTVVINTAAVTSLETCEKEKLKAVDVNALGTLNLARACDSREIYFIHLSSGCIFESKDKNDARVETDAPAPAAFYSWTKVWAENMVTYRQSAGFKYLILRPRQPVSARVSPKNMLIKFLTFTKYVDTPNTGTVLEDLMEWTYELIKIKPIGVVHVANEGFSTPYEIGLMLKKHVLPGLNIEKISKEQLDKMTPNRRVDTVLNVEKLKSFGIKVEPFKKRVEEIIIKLGENIRASEKGFLTKVLTETADTSKQRTTVNECWKDLLG